MNKPASYHMYNVLYPIEIFYSCNGMSCAKKSETLLAFFPAIHDTSTKRFLKLSNEAKA